MSRLHLEAAHATHVGRRQHNEDAFLCEPDLGLFAVADGMGGYEGGEVASGIVVATLRDFFERNAADDDVTWPFGLDPARSLGENMVAVAARLAQHEVCFQRTGRLARMGSTLAAVVVQPGEVVVGHVGDSRVYRMRDGALERLTRDHSFVEEMQLRGAKLPDAGFRHVITRCIGMPDSADPDLRREEPRAGDVYLVCSDGLTEPLADDAIEACLGLSAPRAAAELVRRAYEAGGSDNITAVVVKLSDAVADADPVPERARGSRPL